jgi:transposase InsO family protein
VAILRSLSSAATVEALDGFFADFGAPEELKSNNGPQFSSIEFNRFCDKRGVRHITSSPEFLQSNGLAERLIETVKAAMLKMFQDR